MKKSLLLGLVALGGLVGAAAGLGAGTEVEKAEAYYAGEADTFRLWVNRGDQQGGQGYTWKVNVGGEEYAPGGYENVRPSTWADGLWLVYYDLPTSIISADGTEVTMKCYNDTDQTLWGETEVFTYNSGDNAQVLYLYKDSEGTLLTTWGIADQYQEDDEDLENKRISAEVFATHVLTAYYTCSESKDNGYGNFRTLMRTWLFREDMTHWIADNDLGNFTIADYAYTEGEYPDYTGEPTVNDVNAGLKYSRMVNNYNAMVAEQSAFLPFSEGNAPLTFVVLGGLALAGLGAGTFALVRSRKKNRA